MAAQEQALALDGAVPENPVDRGLGQRRPQRGHLPGALGAGAGSLP